MANLVGAAIDRGDEDSGIKGAIVDTVAESAIRFAAPIVATYALGWVVQYGLRKVWQGLVGDDPVNAQGQLKAERA